MTIMTGILRRHHDISGVSGLGDVAELAEFSDGAVAVRWHGDHPSTAVWNDIRDVEFIHGHQGATEIVFAEDPARLLSAYQTVTPYILTAQPHIMPLKADAHPDRPDRLRVILQTEQAWRWWIALLDGSSEAATYEQVNGEIASTWISSDGNIWLQFFTPGTLTELLEGERYEPNPLAIFDQEDR